MRIEVLSPDIGTHRLQMNAFSVSMQNTELQYRAGYVAIVGEPNVGKSTLLNAILKQKLSIVTRKPQTTRQRVLGIYSTEEFQIVFQDTPGLLEPKYLLHESMVRSADLALLDSDAIVIMIQANMNAELPRVINEKVIEQYPKIPKILLINKVDLIDRNEVLPLIDVLSKKEIFEAIVPVSALKKENLDAFINSLKGWLPVSPPFYPPDVVSEQPERFFVAEIIRGKIFEQYHEEIPYAAAVEIREYKERENGVAYISADVIVEKQSQKGILIGKKGSALKALGSKARIEIELFIERSVYLELHVRVRENWRKEQSIINQLGYE